MKLVAALVALGVMTAALPLEAATPNRDPSPVYFGMRNAPPAAKARAAKYKPAKKPGKSQAAKKKTKKAAKPGTGKAKAKTKTKTKKAVRKQA
jgi:hypothetical protein